MVQLPHSLHSHKVEDFCEEKYAPLSKRPRFAAAPLDQGSTNHEFRLQPPQYNPIDEPTPLGLRLKKSPSLLDLIQMMLSQSRNAPATNSGNRKNVKVIASSSANDKLKASNFPASLLRIGSWEYVSRYEGDLVAKCYFAKHKLVWEVLEGGLKSKIEMQWSDIVALKADCSDNNPCTLTIVLARQPAFFRETNPQPRKHTLWQASSDFTDGQASINRLHYIECPPGVLTKHYEKLIQCDTRLSILSQQPEKIMCPPYFEPEASVLENPEESQDDQSSQLPAIAKGSPSFSFSLEQSPSIVPGLHPCMSMSDLMNHVGNCISEQLTSGNIPSDKASECQNILENISQVLLSDTQHTSGLDEKSLMKRVNSLCCLLQDPVVASGGHVAGGNCRESVGNSQSVGSGIINDVSLGKANFKMDMSTGISNKQEENGISNKQEENGLQRKDSFADLLLHLPRIASLPKFLSGIAEVDE